MLFLKASLSARFDRSFAPRSGVRLNGCAALRTIASSRATAVVALLVFVVSSWIGAWHDATTLHVRCAQHGELVDRGAPLASEARSAASERDASVHRAPDDAVGGDVHCSLSSMIRTSRVVPDRPVLAAAPLAVATRAVAVVQVVVARDRARYRTAPKTSPPV